MKKYFLISLTILTIIGMYSLIFLGLKSENKSNISDKPKTFKQTKKISPILSGYKRQSISPYYKKKASITEAARNLPFSVKLPKETLGAKLAGAYSYEHPAESLDRRFKAIYEDGLEVTLLSVFDLPPAGTRKYVSKAPSLEELYADKPDFFEIDINGIQGYAREPGDYITEGMESTGGGYVAWRIGDVDYRVFHPSLSVKELLKVAESVPLE